MYAAFFLSADVYICFLHRNYAGFLLIGADVMMVYEFCNSCFYFWLPYEISAVGASLLIGNYEILQAF